METNGAQTFGQFLKGYFKGLLHMLTHPLSLLPTLLISAAWIVLGIMHTRYGESQWMAWANFFTFAQGGLFGGTAGGFAFSKFLGVVGPSARLEECLSISFERKDMRTDAVEKISVVGDDDDAALEVDNRFFKNA